MNAMLLCAGLGTRFRPTTEKVAKTAIPFLNVPLMGYPLSQIEKLGLERLVINTHHLPESVKSAAGQLTVGQKYEVTYLHESPRILGPGGGVKNAQAHLPGDDFLVVNGDEVLLFPHDKGFSSLVEFHRRSGALATLLTTNHPEAGKSLGGVWFDADSRITRLGEKGDGAKHFTGVFVFSRRIFDWLPEGPSHIFKDALLPAIAKGEKVMAFHDAELLWLDMSSERAFIESTRMALTHLKDRTPFATSIKAVWERFNAAPDSFDNESLRLFGRGATVGASVEIKGFAVFGMDCRFDNGIIEDSVIAPGVQVHEMVALKRQLVI